MIKLDIFFSNFLWIPVIPCFSTWWRDSKWPTISQNCAALRVLTHWGRVTHICVGKLTILGSDNGLSSGRRQAIIWTNAGILLIGPLGTNFSEILIGIQTFSFKEMRLKMSSAKWRPFCLGLNELTISPRSSRWRAEARPERHHDLGRVYADRRLLLRPRAMFPPVLHV